MKTLLHLIIIIVFAVFLNSCAKNDKIQDGIIRGIYKGANQAQEMKSDDPLSSPNKETPTYEQYERERKEILTDQENNQ